METEEQFISLDILGTLRRRKWWGIAVGAICMAAATAAALLLPPTYESTATILIEEPDVPDDLVKSTVSTFAAQRLQLIQQRVMTSENLSQIIDRFSLYAEALQITPRSEVIAGMRSKIDLEIVSADLLATQTPKQQQAAAATIAFTLAFDYGDARTAQQVANRLTDLYLAENARSRQEQAAGTTEFLAAESQRLYSDVQVLAQKIQEFKAKYAGALPEQLPMNTQILNQAQTALMNNQRDLQSLAEKRSFLETQLAQISPYQPMTSGGRPATPQAQLMSLELEYLDLSAKYGAGHPDVIRAKKQIEALKKQLGTSATQTPAQGRLSQMQEQLAQMLDRYGEKHPEVQKLRKQVDELKGEIASSSANSGGDGALTAPKGPPDNPIYIQLETQLGDTQAEIRGLESQMADLRAKTDALEKAVLTTPAIEGEYSSLTEQYAAAVNRYQTFKDKEADARVAENMEQQSKGETFSVVEAPQLPEVPIKPNRKLLLAAGAAFSLILAAATMVGLETLDPKIYQGQKLQTAFGEMPLAVVPYIMDGMERRWRWGRRAGIALGCVVAVVGVLAYVNQTMPLDVLYAALINRINP